MGGVDTNDQAAEIHIFQSEQSIKWRKKVFFQNVKYLHGEQMLSFFMEITLEKER